MDTSETYIKQCEKAEEIQEQAIFLTKSYWGDKIHVDTLGNYWMLMKGKAIWLPRQDQLIELLGWKMYEHLDYLAPDEGFHWKLIHEIVSTWEQFWLHVLMKEKYNKVWNGEEWTLQDICPHNGPKMIHTNSEVECLNCNQIIGKRNVKCDP